MVVAHFRVCYFYDKCNSTGDSQIVKNQPNFLTMGYCSISLYDIINKYYNFERIIQVIMDKNQSLIGAILKIERIKQNRSQKEVCYGICVPSYLSKMEGGSVKPDKEIVEKLYKRLGIEFVGEGEPYNNLHKMIKEYFYKLEYALDREELYSELYRYDKQLTFSKLAIEWLMIKGLHDENIKESLLVLKSYMTPLQIAYFQICGMEYFEDIKEKVAVQERAANLINNSFALAMLCTTYLEAGDYVKIHQLENKIIALALNEGNTYQLADYYFINGTAYACVNMEEMMIVNYERTIRFLQNTKWANDLSHLYYNMGATYISLKKYDCALEYLYKADQEQGGRNFYTNQKIAIAYIRNGQIDTAKEFLDKLEKDILKEFEKDSLEYLMYEEVLWECQKDFLNNPEYLILLEKLIKKIKKERHFGYLYFYHDVVTEAYINGRQYKKALEFQKSISLIR